MQPEQCVNCGNTADKHILTSSDCGDDIGTMHCPDTCRPDFPAGRHYIWKTSK